MTSCELFDDSADDPTGSSLIQGKVLDFEVAAAKRLMNISKAVRGGIKVTIEGPVTRSTTTSDDGLFVFSLLPAGDYKLKFEYNGSEIRYRGNSGQEATISVLDNQRVEAYSIEIKGGSVNIGNLRIVELGAVDDVVNNEENTEEPAARTTTAPVTADTPSPTPSGNGSGGNGS